MTRDEAQRLDSADPLRALRRRFHLPDHFIYLDGNSLGALPAATAPRLAEVAERQWGNDLITSWAKHDWIDWPIRIAGRLAAMLGARANELLIADSTSVSLFKLLGAAIEAQPGRRFILTQTGNFPTDAYVAEGLAKLVGNVEIRAVDPDRLVETIDRNVAIVYLTHVDYRSGSRHDMAKVNAAARAAGALNLWDLSHSAGAIALDLAGDDCDLAVGCGYKYLNGGPGAPAFLFVAEALQGRLRSPIAGWMGHDDPFAFADDYCPAPGIARFLTGTPSILALAALDCGLAAFDGVTMEQVETKSRALSQLFLDEVERRCGETVTLASPRDPAARGSHLCFSHHHGQAVMQALIERGVIGDFRPPDLLRFGFTPLYTGFDDVWRAAEQLGELLAGKDWEAPRFRQRARIS